MSCRGQLPELLGPEHIFECSWEPYLEGHHCISVHNLLAVIAGSDRGFCCTASVSLGCTWLRAQMLLH